VNGDPGVRVDPLIALPESRAREAARDAGMVGYASVPVRAEGRPVALLEFFCQVEPPSGGTGTQPSGIRAALELVAVELGLLASRARMREAVRVAAAHARRQATELDSLRSRDPAAILESGAHAEREQDGAQASPVSVTLYDEHTGLPRREILLDRIRQAIRRRQRSPRDQFAVVVAELQGLDRVRDRGGDEAVADLRVAAGRRLAGRTRPADTTAHDGDRRFVLVVEGIASIAEAVEVAERAQKELQRPFPGTHSDVRIRASIGVVLGGPAYDDPEIVLADAAVAARRAAASRQRVQVFDRAVEEKNPLRERLRGDLAKAMEREQFFLEYQPIVSLRDGRISGLETFLRWRHPEHGLIPPADFIPVAADSRIIHDLGFWVLEEVCEQINAWRGHLGSVDVPPVEINVMARQIHADSFLSRVRELLEQHGVKGQMIRFDVSEADLMADAEKAARVLDRLHGMGIRVAIDDFGTGFSSLSLLHDLPVGALKIDRSFVSEPTGRTKEWGVAKTIVELARILELDVIAEGIETREQFITLRRAGCTLAQGYHFSGPVAPEVAEAMIRDGYPLDLEAPLR
jgi:Amt family ammonium transporter